MDKVDERREQQDMCDKTLKQYGLFPYRNINGDPVVILSARHSLIVTPKLREGAWVGSYYLGIIRSEGGIYEASAETLADVPHRLATLIDDVTAALERASGITDLKALRGVVSP